MLMIGFSINDHVIGYTSDTWHTLENHIKLPLENIMCND